MQNAARATSLQTLTLERHQEPIMRGKQTSYYFKTRR
uniref:Uncharacterized protein n=1 Tax=Setaria viridis TaxID=4556 RepID=A0A4U6W230_SETVI|nr:hypothetical protein SEVIR_2G105400v2 [Setaria viridis]